VVWSGATASEGREQRDHIAELRRQDRSSCGAKTAAAAAGEGEGGAAEEMVREQDEVIRNKEEEIKTKRRSRSA
jgi:hypothetical protein